MSDKRNVNLFIQAVFDAIDKINGYVSCIKNATELKEAEQVHDAVMMNF